MPVRRFENTQGRSNKFWEIERVRKVVNVRWGPIGARGQTQTKSFHSTNLAERYMANKIGEKLRKGYAEAQKNARRELQEEADRLANKIYKMRNPEPKKKKQEPTEFDDLILD